MPSALARPDPSLELTVRSIGAAHSADLRLDRDPELAPVALATGAPISFDLPALLANAADARAYGRLLTGMVFASDALKIAWASASGHRASLARPLRCRLRIDASDPQLHGLRWELLQDPRSHAPLALSDDTPLARLIDTSAAAVESRTYAQLRALVAMSAPTDQAQYALAPIDALAEASRALEALGEIPSAQVGGREGDRLSAEGLDVALRRGADLLYLVCHGKILDDLSYALLEQPDGAGQWVPGEAIVEVVTAQHRRPALVLLASCESAGSGLHSMAGALGPQLVAGGVGAVVAMQGPVSFSTVARLVPALFAALHRHGDIERAVVAARGALRDDDTWWQPALFTRLRGGRLWQIGPVTATADTTEGRINELLRQIGDSKRPVPERVKAAEDLAALGDPRPGVCTPLPLCSEPVPEGVYPVRAQMRRIGSETRQASRQPEAMTHLDAFAIARHPVTVWQYQQFLDVGGYDDPRWWTPQGLVFLAECEPTVIVTPAQWERPGRLDSQPVVGVSWYEATAFCRWLDDHARRQGWITAAQSLRLPTEAEWEVAAAWDGTVGAIRHWALLDDPSAVACEEALPEHRFPPSVGCFPHSKSPCGARDMAGGVWEWCASAASGYPDTAASAAADFDLAADHTHGPVVRGGSFRDPAREVGWFARRAEHPAARLRNVGFRVVLSNRNVVLGL